MRTKATPLESSTPWERPKLWELEPVGGYHPSEWSENVMDHCALRAHRPSVFEPCRSLLALERSIKRNKQDYGLSSVVGGTRKHEWVAGDRVRIAIGEGAHTTGVIVALPDPVVGRGWWKVRRDGEKKIRSARKNALGALPRPLRHLWDASVTYNDRWFESRAEMYALLMGRQRRLGKGSVCKWVAGNHIVWRRIAEYALAPVSYLDLREGSHALASHQGNLAYWNGSPVHLRPDPRRGVVALAHVDRTPDKNGDENEEQYPMSPRTFVAGVSAVGVSRLRVLRLDWSGDLPDDDPYVYNEPRVYSKDVAHEVLRLVAEHCRELRALRISGSYAGDGSAEDREPIARVLEQCAELRVLWVFDCLHFMPIPTPGRQYALTHIHIGMFDVDNHQSPATFSAWVDAAPNLQHYGCTNGFCESEGLGIDFLEAAADAANLETLDLYGWGAHLDETNAPTNIERLDYVMWALPQNLRIAPYGPYPGAYPGEPGDPIDNETGDFLREAARRVGREDLEILKYSTSPRALENVFDASSTRRPILWDWFEAIKPLCYA